MATQGSQHQSRSPEIIARINVDARFQQFPQLGQIASLRSAPDF